MKSIYTTMRKINDYKNCMSILNEKEKQIIKKEYNELMKQRTKYGENFIIPSIQDFVIDYVNYAIELKNIKEEYREEKSKHIDFCFMEIPYIPEDSLNGLSGITFKKLKVPWDKKTNTLYDPIAMVHMDELVFEDLNIKVKRDGTIIRMNID